MRQITDTHTGEIISDTDLTLEYLFVGDYGKENNIKADFLGYDKRIEKVEHKPVDIREKLVVTVSSQKGCPMHCNFCDCPKLGFKGNASLPELMMEITSGIALSGIRHGERLNVHYARMGEPTFNQNVIASAKQIAHMLADPDSDIHFNTYHPVISTMMPKANNNLKEFLHKWVKTGFEYDEEELQMMIKDLLNLCLEDKESYTIPAWAYSYFNEDDVKERGRKYFTELDDGDDTYFQKNFYTVWWFDFRR